MNGGFKGADVFTTEFEINETPPSARTLLTKGYIQDEINTFSGMSKGICRLLFFFIVGMIMIGF